MKIFSNDNELKEQLEASAAENTELSALVEKREEEIKSLTEQVATLEAANAEQVEQLEELQKQTASLENEAVELASKLEESQEAQTEFDSKVAAAALAQMQELGSGEPVETMEEEEETDIFAKYRALQTTNPRQATEFWNENKAALLAHQ